MSTVKQSHSLCSCAFLAAGLLAVAGCANGDLSRFAPPGIVKYEEIAGDKPQNPAVAARIAERKAEKGAGSFPNLSLVPGEKERPERRPAADVEAEKQELLDLRETLAEEVATDRDVAQSEQAGNLHEERDALKQQVESDSKEAARERREKLEPPSQPQ